MDKLSSLTRFKAACPFLGRTKQSTLRSLSTSNSARFPSLSRLTERATKCPIMGPALNTRSQQIVAGYASVAANFDVEKLHREQGVSIPSSGASIEQCPHASAARAAARMADDLAAAATTKKALNAKSQSHLAGCPAHQRPAVESSKPKHIGFDYEAFYKGELAKKHQDKSYRYFNNINRLARKFPVAHTANPKDEVEVWCANDYLGMGNNPIVLETMQCV
jgi:5-aminolevulinate synthase